MDAAANFLAGQCFNHPFDLPPVAEAHDIAVAAEPPGTRRRFEGSAVAVMLHELGGIGKGKTSVDEDRIHDGAVYRIGLEGLPTSVVNAALTISRGLAVEA